MSRLKSPTFTISRPLKAAMNETASRTFGVSTLRRPAINLIRTEDELSKVHLRLTTVVIENLPALEFIQRYDNAKTLFYYDPPYHKCPYYEHNMVLEDYIDLAGRLSNIKGKFILGINDHPDMQDAFGAFNIKPVSLKYTAGVGQSTKGKELIVTNY